MNFFIDSSFSFVLLNELLINSLDEHGIWYGWKFDPWNKWRRHFECMVFTVKFHENHSFRMRMKKKEKNNKILQIKWKSDNKIMNFTIWQIKLLWRGMFMMTAFILFIVVDSRNAITFTVESGNVVKFYFWHIVWLCHKRMPFWQAKCCCKKRNIYTVIWLSIWLSVKNFIVSIYCKLYLILITVA